VIVLFAAALGAVILGGGSALALAVGTAVFASATVLAVALAATSGVLLIAVRRERQALPSRATGARAGQEHSASLAR